MTRTTEILMGLILASALPAVWAAPAPPNAATPLEENVRKGLVTIPFLTVFDDLSYRVDNGVVTLSGEASQPIVKDYAEEAVKHLPGVTAVNDRIEVLPLSRFDDQIRFQTLRALNGAPSLYRYFMGTYPSIRIVVKNGHVTLDGVVQNSMDSQLAFTAANRVPGVFSVTNNLRLEPKL